MVSYTNTGIIYYQQNKFI